jgi:phosphatidylglycerol lysyltransferase
VPQSVALGSLLAFRLIYYLLPLAVAVLLLLAFELHQRREDLGKAVKIVGSWLPALEPHLLAALTFLGGAAMLVFGSIPAAPARLHWLADFVPLAILELSHFLGSLVGIGLIVLAQCAGSTPTTPGQRLLAPSIVLSLLRGLHVEAAIFLALMLAARPPGEPLPPHALPSEPFSPGLPPLAMVVIGAVIGLFAYRHVDYLSELWWQFELHRQRLASCALASPSRSAWSRSASRLPARPRRGQAAASERRGRWSGRWWRARRQLGHLALLATSAS